MEEGHEVSELDAAQMFDHVAVGVLVVDVEGQEQYRNGSTDRLLGGTLLSNPQRLPRRLASLAQRCQSSGEPAVECFEPTSDDNRGVRLSASPLSDGRTVITVELLKRSEHVQERVRQFVAHITHDLRTPLTSVLGASDLLLSGRVGAPEERHAKLLRIVGEGTQKMATLLGEISARFVDVESEAVQ